MPTRMHAHAGPAGRHATLLACSRPRCCHHQRHTQRSHLDRLRVSAASPSGSGVGPPAAPAGAMPGPHQPVQLVAGLKDVVAGGSYKALLLDQFGVLHDGRTPYPGAVHAVRRAAEAGFRLLLISNSSRRSAGTLGKLEAMGFPAGAFEGVVTSGELTHRYLTQRPDAWWQGLGRRCLHINWLERGPISLDGYGLEVTCDPLEAELVVAHGTEGVTLPRRPRATATPTAVSSGEGAHRTDGAAGRAVVGARSVDELVAMLQGLAEGAGAAGRQPPVMVVANPDLVTVDGGELVTMPGALAAAYERAGGRVVLMGKPAPLIYQACAEVLGVPAHQILAVGDSLEHDIGGASQAGIQSLFIGGGIHAKDVLMPLAAAAEDGGSAASQAGCRGVDMIALQGLCAKYGGVRPTYATASFSW